MGNLVKYDPNQYTGFSDEDAQEERKTIDNMGGGKFRKLKPGKNYIRLLPGAPGKKPYLRVRQHFLNWAGYQGSVRCLGKTCPICKKVEELKGSRNKANKKLGDKMFASTKWYWAGIDRDNPDEGPGVYTFGKTIADQLTTLREDLGDFTHPLQGYDVCIRKRGSEMKTKYTVTQSEKGPISDDEDEIQTWLESLPDLEQAVGEKTVGELEELFERDPDDEDADDDDADDDDDEDDEDEPPKAKVKAKPKRTAADDAEEVEGEVVDDADDDDDEDEDEPPKKAVKKPAAAPGKKRR